MYELNMTPTKCVMHTDYVRVIVCSFLRFERSGSIVSSAELKHEGSTVLHDQLPVDRLGLV